MTPLWDAETEARVRAAKFTLDKQATPKEVRFCKRCVVSNQRPRIVFDEEGVCSACRFYEHVKTIDWAKRREELGDLLSRHRRKGSYDVIVPCSGGKDSSMVAHRLKHEFGMTPLCIKWAPFAYTDIGRRNFESFIHAGFDAIEISPDGLNHRRLSRLAFDFLGDAWQPFAYGQVCAPIRAASHFGISLVFGGENGEAWYGGDTSANDKPCWSFEDWERVYLKGAGVANLIETGRDLGADIEPGPFYTLPEKRDGIQYHWLSYYLGWNPQENYYYAADTTGFEANPERSEGTYSRYASLDDMFDGFHYFLAYLKFGIGRCTSDAAHEIRDGILTREEGIALVKKYDGEFPKRHFAAFLDYLSLDEKHFQTVCDRWRGKAWRLSNGEWVLRKAVWDAEAPSSRAA